ncbi:MAG: hypothetical protein HWN65_20385 [Candidatus Helarchaeota archaeon]|nr:hypothetical protein [Candidatus Helarchaeota archaeon]
MVLQKRQVNLKSTPDSAEQSTASGSKFSKDPIWILSILMQAVFPIPLAFLAFMFIGIALAQPLASASIVFLVLGLMLMLGERLKSKLEYLGLVILTFGIIGIALSGIGGPITLGLFLSTQINFWILFSIIIALAMTSLILAIKIPKIKLICLGVLAGCCSAVGSVLFQSTSLAILELSHPSAILVLVLGILGVIASIVLYFLVSQEAFKQGKAIKFIPSLYGSMNVLAVFAGLFVFQQSISNFIFFWVGLPLIIAGVSLLARVTGE